MLSSREEARAVWPLPIEIGNNATPRSEKRNLEENKKAALSHLPNLTVKITLPMGRVEVGAGVEVHDQVEPRRHKCLSGKVVRSGEEREFANSNFSEISTE